MRTVRPAHWSAASARPTPPASRRTCRRRRPPAAPTAAAAAATRSSARSPPPMPLRLAEPAQRGGRVVVGEHPQVDAAGDHAVLDVVHRVGDVVGPVHHLGLQAGPALGRTVAHPVGRGGVVVVETELACRCGAACHGYFVTASSAARVRFSPALRPCGVKDFGLEPGQDAEVLRVALEPAEGVGDLVERAFAVVPVRRMADVVGQPGQVDEVGIAAQPDRPSRGRSAPPPANASAGCAGSRSAAARRPASCRPAGAARRCAAPGRGRGRSRCGARCRSPAARHPSAPRPPGAAGRSRRRGRLRSWPPTHSLPGPFAGTGCPSASRAHYIDGHAHRPSAQPGPRGSDRRAPAGADRRRQPRRRSGCPTTSPTSAGVLSGSAAQPT